MEPLKTYRGTLHNGHLVTDTPLADTQPLRVLVTVVDERTDSQELVDIRRATRPLDLNSPESQRLRELLSSIPGGLVDAIIEERRSED